MCDIVCRATLNGKYAKEFKRKIDFEYRHKYEGECSNKIEFLTNCDSLAKYSGTGNDSLQDIEDEKEIIFNYNVEFQCLGMIPITMVYAALGFTANHDPVRFEEEINPSSGALVVWRSGGREL
ncbi:hypothetical protein F511_25236 [Dorcoceras hygrometricum]|uniref:Uncharacterized protein n=1 Tax=Dorcoceras hygrometricum TaxID=472368 RepID=A0A2Z7BF23_9LAMI|nr:hypothetical protein F511_25236 [Dorcoceras hygrometricum]